MIITAIIILGITDLHISKDLQGQTRRRTGVSLVVVKELMHGIAASKQPPVAEGYFLS